MDMILEPSGKQFVRFTMIQVIATSRMIAYYREIQHLKQFVIIVALIIDPGFTIDTNGFFCNDFFLFIGQGDGVVSEGPADLKGDLVCQATFKISFPFGISDRNDGRIIRF